GARPGIPHRRAGEPVKPPVHDASARQHSGEPSSGLGPVDIRTDRVRTRDLAELESCEIAGLVDRSTQELRRAWRTLHHTGPPLGLSRDLIIRGLADQLQQRAHGGPSRALQRRLQILAGEFEKGARSFDPGGVLKTGATLVRQWRGHTRTVLVRENGFEYDGQRYRSLTVIAERITGAHWSGPRFFGLNKRAREASRRGPTNERQQPRDLTSEKLLEHFTSAACLARSADRARLCSARSEFKDLLRVQSGEGRTSFGSAGALVGPIQGAMRYWNMAQQRYYRRLARIGKPCASLPTRSPSQPR